MDSLYTYKLQKWEGWGTPQFLAKKWSKFVRSWMCVWYFAFYYSYWCKFLQKYAISKLTNGTRAYDRFVLPDAKRTKTVSNVQSEVIKVLNSGKNKNSYTTNWPCITILLSHIPKSLYPKKKKKKKKSKTKVHRCFIYVESFEGSKYMEQYVYTTIGDTEKNNFYLCLCTRKHGFLTLQNTAVCQCIGHHYQTTTIEIQRN